MGFKEQILGLEGGAPVAVTVEMVRDQLRDYPKFNEIVKQDLSDDEYADIVLRCIDEWNMMPPYQDCASPQNFYDRSLLLDWSTCEALKRLVLWHSRNQWSAEDAGLTVPIHEQWQPLWAIYQTMKADVKERAKEQKTMFNIRRGFGDGVASPLWLR